MSLCKVTVAVNEDGAINCPLLTRSVVVVPLSERVMRTGCRFGGELGYSNCTVMCTPDHLSEIYVIRDLVYVRYYSSTSLFSPTVDLD